MHRVQSTPAPTSAEPERVISIPWLIVILGLLTASGPLSIDMYLPALPGIAQDLQTSTATVQQTLSIYFLGMAFGQLFYGPLSDRFGRKGPLQAGLLLYLLASIGCVWVPHIQGLIALRLLQALGGCAGVVIARAIARDCFEPQEMARVMSLLMLVMGLAPILAPLAGGLLLKAFGSALGWRLIFAVLALIGALSMLMVMRLPETLPPSRRLRRISLTESLRTYIQISRARRFLAPTLSGGLIMGCLFAYLSGSSAVFVEYFQLSPLQYSWLFGLNAVGIIGFSQLNRVFLRTLSPVQVMHRFFRLVLMASCFLSLLSGLGQSLWGVALALWVVLACLGVILPNSAAVALADQREQAGSASAVMGVIQYSIGALSAAAVGLLMKGLGGHPQAMSAVMLLASLLAWWIDLRAQPLLQDAPESGG